ASPSDVVEERNLIREVINRWNAINSYKTKIVLLPVAWETHISPEMGNKPQAIINKRILNDCDLLVGVFWTRVGTATEEYESGTIEEIEEHIKAGKPAMLYFSKAKVDVEDLDNVQLEKLEKFKKSCVDRGIYKEYKDKEEFKNNFYEHLQININEHEYFVTDIIIEDIVITETENSDISDLSKEAKILLTEVTQDSHGLIYQFRDSKGTSIQTNNKVLIESENAREIAKWESALEELDNKGLIKPEGYQGEAFKVTKKGYEVADLLKS
ncbi:MAG: DUF4062 domain-containing protein, partial [Bacteroidetes bacterium]|nr:DUF4062 domain-containing protein [Bacteroidota bacterium]